MAFFTKGQQLAQANSDNIVGRKWLFYDEGGGTATKLLPIPAIGAWLSPYVKSKLQKGRNHVKRKNRLPLDGLNNQLGPADRAKRCLPETFANPELANRADFHSSDALMVSHYCSVIEDRPRHIMLVMATDIHAKINILGKPKHKVYCLPKRQKSTLQVPTKLRPYYPILSY